MPAAVLVIVVNILIIFSGGNNILLSHVPHYGTNVGSNIVLPSNAIIRIQPGSITKKNAHKQLTAIGPLLLVPNNVAIKHEVLVITKPIQIHTIKSNKISS